MCQGIPRQVLESAPGKVRVAIQGEPRWVKAAARAGAAVPGEFVIVYAGVAIEQVSREEAEEHLRFLADLAAAFPEDEP